MNMRELVEFIGVAGVVLGMLLVLSLPVIGLALLLDSYHCASRANAMQLSEHSWGPLQGCIVRYKGELIPIDAIGVRVFDRTPQPDVSTR